MHIVMVSNTYLPVLNGVTISVAAWVEALRRVGHNVTVWTIAKTVPETPDVVATHGVSSVLDDFPFPTSSRAPKGLLDTADVVHIHHPVVLGRIALRESRRLGVPVVATAHSDYLHYLESYAWKPARPAFYAYGRSLMRSTFNACETVMAPSQSITHRLESWGVTSPIVAVDYAIDPSGLPSIACKDARHRLGLDGGPLAFYAGRLAPEKGLAELISEFRRVHDAVPHARLAIAGDGPSRPRLHEMIVAQGLVGAVLPLGPLGHGELGLWYSAANLYVSASSNEVGPLTAIEAQLCGTPVVAYRAPGFEDRVETGRTGLLVDNRPGELATAMIDLLENPVRAERMGVNAKSSARLRYDSGRVVEQLLSVYGAARN